jgi:hypothetical protein
MYNLLAGYAADVSVKSIKNEQNGITSETKMVHKTMEKKIVQAHVLNE